MAELRRCKGTWAFCDGYCEKCNTTVTTQNSIMYLIPPNADVVEVVRCKECKYRKGAFHTDRRWKEGGYWLYWCELDTGDPFELGRNAEDDNWFCADGERRTDDDRNG